MKVQEYSKPVPAKGFLARMFGQTVTLYSLAFIFAPDTVEELNDQFAAAKKVILDWVAMRANRDFILVTAFAEQTLCDAIEEKMKRLCREDTAVAPLLEGLSIELSFNAEQKKSI